MKNNKKILITGATGFIGTCLVKKLVEKGETPLCLVLPNDDYKEIEEMGADIEFGDITDRESLNAVINHNISVIYHLAASVGDTDEEILYKVNFEGTKNIIDVCIDKDIKLNRFVFISSLAAAGPVEKGILSDESKPPKPVSLYGKSKLLSEKYLFSLKGGFPFTIIRLPLVYGPRSIGGLLMVFRMLNKHLEIMLPEMETNIIFVEDVALALMKVVETDDTVGEIFHIGEEKVYNTKEILRIIKETLKIKTIKIPMPAFFLYLISFVSELYAKIRNTEPVLKKKNIDEYVKYRYWGYRIHKAKEYFGFDTTVPFEKGLVRTSEWYDKNIFKK